MVEDTKYMYYLYYIPYLSYIYVTHKFTQTALCKYIKQFYFQFLFRLSIENVILTGRWSLIINHQCFNRVESQLQNRHIFRIDFLMKILVLDLVFPFFHVAIDISIDFFRMSYLFEGTFMLVFRQFLCVNVNKRDFILPLSACFYSFLGIEIQTGWSPIEPVVCLK